jgi:DNA-binding response OmpR family regulator
MRILVAEDDASLEEYLHQRLLQEEFAVQMVASGPEGNAMLQTSPTIWWCWI